MRVALKVKQGSYFLWKPEISQGIYVVCELSGNFCENVMQAQ